MLRLLVPVLFAACALAQQPAPSALESTPDGVPKGFARVVTLWPGAAPGSTGSTAADIPKMFVYPVTSPGPHPAVIVLPGGGYNHLVMEKEGGVEARWLASHGVVAFVLQYRLAPYRFPIPMHDGARAIRYVRAHASELGVDPAKVGIWGFSAGGHLAGYLATNPDEPSTASDPIDRQSAHPDFAIFSYARFSLDPEIPRTGNMEPLIGDNPSPQALDSIWITKHVTSKTSPSFIYSTTNDQTVNSLNATAYYDALKRAGVQVELHIFELGPHGTGMGQNLPNLTELSIWPLLLEQWMELHGWMPPVTMGP